MFLSLQGAAFGVVAPGGIAPPAAVVRATARRLLLQVWKGLTLPYQLQTLPIHPPAVSPLPMETTASSPGAGLSREGSGSEGFAGQASNPQPQSKSTSPFRELEGAGRRHSVLLRLVRRSATKTPEWVLMDVRIKSSNQTRSHVTAEAL